jgi:hypothetical protein
MAQSPLRPKFGDRCGLEVLVSLLSRGGTQRRARRLNRGAIGRELNPVRIHGWVEALGHEQARTTSRRGADPSQINPFVEGQTRSGCTHAVAAAICGLGVRTAVRFTSSNCFRPTKTRLRPRLRASKPRRTERNFDCGGRLRKFSFRRPGKTTRDASGREHRKREGGTMIPLVGYVDRFSARPGERIEVKVSSSLNEPYQADLVPPRNTPVRPQLQVETFRIGLNNLLIGEAFPGQMHRALSRPR